MKGAVLYGLRDVRFEERSTPKATVAVVGDGAVGLLGVLSARQMEAGRIIAMRRHSQRQKLALEFGATEIVTERGDEALRCATSCQN